MNRVTPFFVLSLIIIMLYPDNSTCRGSDKMNGPTGPRLKNDLEIYGEGDNFFINAYQKWFSPVKGGNTCPMHPSCSQYAKITFRVFPWYQAYIFSLDRLLRCGHELILYDVVRVQDRILWYDPVKFEGEKGEGNHITDK